MLTKTELNYPSTDIEIIIDTCKKSYMFGLIVPYYKAVFSNNEWLNAYTDTKDAIEHAFRCLFLWELSKFETVLTEEDNVHHKTYRKEFYAECMGVIKELNEKTNKDMFNFIQNTCPVTKKPQDGGCIRTLFSKAKIYKKSGKICKYKKVCRRIMMQRMTGDT
jgi:hypothetical protein